MTTDLDTIEAKARQAEALPMSKSNGCVTLKISDVLRMVERLRKLDVKCDGCGGEIGTPYCGHCHGFD